MVGTSDGAWEPAPTAAATPTGSMVAVRRQSPTPPSARGANLADLIGLDRLGEAMADVIEAALIDAGVDLS